MTTDTPDGLLGRSLDGTWSIEEKLGAGGMGAVYRGRHAATGQLVAIKVLLPELASNDQALRRLRREAESVARLGHPGIVGVHDFARLPDGTAYMVMDFLEGQDLDARLSALRGSMSWEDALQITVEAGAALAAAHQVGVVHRDLKPANLFLTATPEGERAMILDFGLAKIMNSDAAMTQLTMTGMVMGTPQYMSPEQASGDTIDHRTDVYALAAVLYEMLANRPPITAPTLPALFAKLLTEDPPPISEACAKPIPSALDQVLTRALAKDPDQRFSTVDELLDALGSLGPPDMIGRGSAVERGAQDDAATAPTLDSGLAQDAIATAGVVDHTPPRAMAATPPPGGSHSGLNAPPPSKKSTGCLVAGVVVGVLTLTLLLAVGAFTCGMVLQSESGSDSNEAHPGTSTPAAASTPATDAPATPADRAPDPGSSAMSTPTKTEGLGAAGTSAPTAAPDAGPSAPSKASTPDSGPPSKTPSSPTSNPIKRGADLAKQGDFAGCLHALRDAPPSRPALKQRLICAKRQGSRAELAKVCVDAARHHPRSSVGRECKRILRRSR